MNFQNMPVGKTVKQTLCADEGFYLAECDLEQAETRDTAYITGDKNLLETINSDKDFHSLNLCAFFGLKYEDVYDEEKKKTKNKPLRDAAKRVNHGATYLMMAQVLVDTMGLKAIYEAARLLNMPRHWEAIQIAAYLLLCFEKTYPTVRGAYPEWVVQQILTHHKLVGATGWTRWCFSNPKQNKHALNAYVAHGAQSLNATVLNKAVMKVFTDVAIHPVHYKNFKLLSQIHDSIFFQYRIGHRYLCEMVKERMEIPVTIKDIKGIERTFTVPAALKLGPNNNVYWSELE